MLDCSTSSLTLGETSTPSIVGTPSRYLKRQKSFGICLLYFIFNALHLQIRLHPGTRIIQDYPVSEQIKSGDYRINCPVLF